jgi:putative intracellular protease/amidase
MNLGSRRIRSAGRSSGSIELTLPAQLQDLEGVECRLLVRDGPRPEIVLQPDLSAAQAVFQQLWGLLRAGLAEADEIGELSLADFSLSLFPGGPWAERPPLACADALALLRARRAGGSEAAPDSLARLLAALAGVAGARLGLRGRAALAFGDTVAYLIAGSTIGLGADFERGMARQQFAGEAGPPLEPASWQRAAPGLQRVFAQFLAWQRQPAAYESARERWYRALALEIGPQ